MPRNRRLESATAKPQACLNAFLPTVRGGDNAFGPRSTRARSPRVYASPPSLHHRLSEARSSFSQAHPADAPPPRRGARRCVPRTWSTSNAQEGPPGRSPDSNGHR